MTTPALPPDWEVRNEFLHQQAPVPPTWKLKAASLRAYLKWSGAKVFVETGTFKGETTAYMAQFCERVYSIELSPTLAKKAQAMFATRPHVKVIHGDSAKVLPEIMKELNEPALFWLDGHWCGPETGLSKDFPVPAVQELEAIFAHPVPGHVALIDDVRCFLGLGGYPTVDELRRLVARHRPDWVFDVAMDSIRLHAPRN